MDIKEVRVEANSDAVRLKAWCSVEGPLPYSYPPFRAVQKGCQSSVGLEAWGPHPSRGPPCCPWSPHETAPPLPHRKISPDLDAGVACITSRECCMLWLAMLKVQ